MENKSKLEKEGNVNVGAYRVTNYPDLLSITNCCCFAILGNELTDYLHSTVASIAYILAALHTERSGNIAKNVLRGSTLASHRVPENTIPIECHGHFAFTPRNLFLLFQFCS
ncbi:hypothetical protein LSTR_LSTR004009 [Laodelphax striatellus]|uniref:Uncharacterized protein n=1 Tax=Laodelphax striatellus TaxID=195883 RepID=A0A482WG07_LAOST|nr:hypothetical protein LSTR_LSTR004009 [Laodelphax striatellus]